MTEAGEQLDVLSREELDAILEEVAGGQSDLASNLAGPFRRPERRASVRAVRMPELRSAVLEGLESWTKQLASRHQRRVECELLAWDEIEMREFGETLLATDRIAMFETEPFGAVGFLLIARPLTFGLLSCEFGGRRNAAEAPERVYTRIEERFLRRTASELLGHLMQSWSQSHPVSARITLLASPEEFAERAPDTAMVAGAEIQGFASVGRLRVALPKAPFAAAEGAMEPARRDRHPELERMLGDVQVPLRAEIGSTRLSLAQLGSLQPGDELFLTPSSSGGFLVRVGGVSKFRATRGSVGGRLAVQVQERITSGSEE